MDKADIRIRELAAASLLDRSRLLAGRGGLDRPVARVVVRDIGPGTRLQVRGGDLVVARRAGVPGGGEGRQLIARLATGGAAALAFVDGHYLPGALAGVRHAADEAGLPLFALPRGVDAPAAAHAIEAALESGGAAAAGHALRAASALARSAREGGVAAIVTTLAAETGLGVLLQAEDGRRLAMAGRADGRRVAARAVPGGELTLHGIGAGVLAEPLLEQAASLVALEAARGDPAAAERARREADAVRRALEPGGAWPEPVVVLAIAGAEQPIAGLLRAELGATCGAADDDLVALLPLPFEQATLDRIVAGAAWGAGAASADIVAGLREARAARALGPAMGRPSTFEAVRVLDGLLRAFGPGGIGELRARVLGDLPPDVEETLAAYLETGLSVAGAAERIYVHKNTVRYRLRRAETLTGRRLDDLADRLELETAILGKLLENPLDGGSRPGVGLS
jgi:hypothetical protein